MDPHLQLIALCATGFLKTVRYYIWRWSVYSAVPVGGKEKKNLVYIRQSVRTWGGTCECRIQMSGTPPPGLRGGCQYEHWAFFKMQLRSEAGTQTWTYTWWGEHCHSNAFKPISMWQDCQLCPWEVWPSLWQCSFRKPHNFLTCHWALRKGSYIFIICFRGSIFHS